MVRTLVINRPARVAVIVALLIPLLALAWWLGSPLVVNRTVGDSFPAAAGASVPPGMSRAEVEQVMAAMAKLDDEMRELRAGK